MRVASTLLLLYSAAVAFSQEPANISRDLIEQRIEAIAETLNDESDIDLTALFDILNDYMQRPLNLNKATIDELATMQLLSDVQVNALKQHIQRTGPLLSIYELQVINGFDIATIQLIRPFIRIGGQEERSRPTLKQIVDNGTSEFVVRSRSDIEERAGFSYRNNLFGQEYLDGKTALDFNDTQVVDSLREHGKVYLGSPYLFYTRYRFKYRNNLSFGITAEKDPGEEFFRGSQKNGFDFYSSHLFLRDIGPLKTLVLGDYLAQFGQGLTFWSGLGFGSKSAYTMNIKKNARGLLPYVSVNENQFLRGVAASYQFNKLELTAFYSRKRLDANISTSMNDLAQGDLSISSFTQDGLHRRPIELNKKDAIDERIIGGHVTYEHKALNLGVTAAQVDFGSKPGAQYPSLRSIRISGK